MTDIASLGIRVQTTGAEDAQKQLAGLTTSAKGAEGAARSAEAAWQKASFSPQKLFTANQALADYKRKLQEAAVAATATGNKTAAAFGSTANSAKQMTQALRQVPMQFTDIATSLASGQRPLQVLLQQGGQLKDLFGGIGPAVRALGGYVLGLINPFTLAAAAVVGLGIAWKTAAAEAQAFNLAIIQTGNFSGHSAEDLEDLAQKLDKTTDATGRFAADILAKVEATGRFTGEQVETVSTAIVNMAKATQLAGGDVDEAVGSLIKSFTDLSKDPVEALLKLNETQHFLTQSTLDQVESLVKQGKQTEAAEVAIKAMADTLNTRAPEMVRNVNSASAVFGGLKSAIAEAGDEAVKFFRDADEGLQRFIRQHEGAVKAIAKLQSFPLLPFGGAQKTITESLLGNANAGLEPTLIGFKPGAKPTVDSAAERRRIKEIEDAQREWNSSVAQGETQAQRLKRELDEAAAAGKRLGKTGAEIASAQDAIRAAFAARAPKGKKPKKENTRGIENASDRFDDMVGNFRAELEGPLQRAEQEHLRRVREIEQAARDGKRSHEDLTAALALEGEAYRKTTADIQHRFDAEVASLTGPLAQAQERHEAALRRIEELRQQGQLSIPQHAAALREEAKAFEQDAEAARRAMDPVGALLSDMRAEVDAIGESNAKRAVMVALREQNTSAMSAEGQAALATAQAFEEEARAKERSIQLMDDFRQGAADALADFATGAKSAKEAFADFFNDLAKRIIQMISERWIEKAFGALGSNGSDSKGGGWIAAIASIFASKNGNAFVSGQPVQAFANGGILDRPTFFGMANGRVGVGGEAGTEAILPLHRGPDGKLGVRMASDGQQHQRPIVNNNTTFYVPDLSSRRNQQQAAFAQQRVLANSTARNR